MVSFWHETSLETHLKLCLDLTSSFVLQGPANNRALRLRVISFLHRMVECLGPHFLPYLPDFLSALMQSTSDKTDLMDVFTLVHQFITRYKAAFHPLLLSVSHSNIFLMCTAQLRPILAFWSYFQYSTKAVDYHDKTHSNLETNNRRGSLFLWKAVIPKYIKSQLRIPKIDL